MALLFGVCFFHMLSLSLSKNRYCSGSGFELLSEFLVIAV